MGLWNFISSSKKKFRHNNLLYVTFLLLVITFIIIVFVYKRIYSLSMRNCWNALFGAGETVEIQFSQNLQYQTLFLKEIEKVFQRNKLTTKSQIIDYCEKNYFSDDLYEIYIIFPDSSIYTSNGILLKSDDKNLFSREGNQGEHFSKITSNIVSPRIEELRHYLPVRIDGKVVAIIYSTIDLAFLSHEGIIPIYNGKVDYLIFNPSTKEVFINTFTKRPGNFISFMGNFRDSEDSINSFIDAVEYRQTFSAKLKIYRENRDMFLYSFPLSYEDFSICIFSDWNIAFKDIKSLKKVAALVSFCLIMLYGFYFITVFKFTKKRIEVSLLEEKVHKAENISNYKTMFLSSMSHDIRTPMNAIVGYINLALINLDNKIKIKQYLSKSLKASNHLLNLINEILDISRIESGKINISNSECNLKEIIQEIENIVTVQTAAKRQNFVIESGSIVHPFVLCDRLHLNQILINILGNSVKYTQKEGEISLIINEKSAASSDSADFEFIIRDNGIGMSSDFMKKIFEPYSRAENVEEKVSGTGLGLAICKKLIENMGGTISIKSAECVGTEITVNMRFKIIEEVEYEKGKYVSLQSEKNSHAPLASSENKYDGRVLLLVDDNQFNREIAREILEDAGFIIEEAVNGQEAYEKVSTSVPDYYSAVLMDIQMPVLNGYEATELIRQLPDEYLSKIPIIAVTANAFNEDIQNARKAGMNAYIVKPISIPKLFKVLDDIFAMREGV